MFAPYCRLYNKKQALFKLLLILFLYKEIKLLLTLNVNDLSSSILNNIY